MKIYLSQYLFLIIYTTLFAALLYVGKEIFFPSRIYEEQYLEPHEQNINSEQNDFTSFSGVTQEEMNAARKEVLSEWRQVKKNKLQEQEKQVFSFRYIPPSFQDLIIDSYVPLAEFFLSSKAISDYSQDLVTFLYYQGYETRGKMKNSRIHMYGIPNLSEEEFLAVFIHEFAHYYDIYELPANAFGDMSNDFYSISWDSTNIMKSGMKTEDFVSGYALTNKYEDFAESYTFYILHNQEFFERAQENDILRRKYDFFRKISFPLDTFYRTDFTARGQEYDTYMWDTTKQDFDIKKFLQYLSSPI